jgi:hypothetical protein
MNPISAQVDDIIIIEQTNDKMFMLKYAPSAKKTMNGGMKTTNPIIEKNIIFEII